ncbi:MAG: hypothetical protein IKT40_09005 [Bacilli bacterium]|nr:hypothetical protein [Bacilli bacterium]
MINLGTNEILEIGEVLFEKMQKLKINSSELVINVDKESFKKIDEDLYYRQNPNGDDFKESEKEINIAYKSINIKIKKQIS